MQASPAITAQQVPIALGDRAYNILIGQALIGDAATWADLPAAHAALIVTNDTVAPCTRRVCARNWQAAMPWCIR